MSKTIKERRHEAAEKGFCGSCRKRRPEPGKKTCEHCLDRSPRQRADHAAYMREYRDEHQPHSAVRFLVCCQSASKHRTGCQEVRRG